LPTVKHPNAEKQPVIVIDAMAVPVLLALSLAAAYSWLRKAAYA
jgi:hypothetical protein